MSFSVPPSPPLDMPLTSSSLRYCSKPENMKLPKALSSGHRTDIKAAIRSLVIKVMTNHEANCADHILFINSTCKPMVISDYSHLARGLTNQ